MGVFRNRLFVPALLAGLAAAGPAMAQSGKSLMEERQGAIGNTQQPDQGNAPKQAVQGDNTAGAGANSAESQARAATGAAPPPGSLQFGGTGTGSDSGAPLMEKRQGAIGGGEKPPEPVEQGGAEQGGQSRQ